MHHSILKTLVLFVILQASQNIITPRNLWGSSTPPPTQSGNIQMFWDEKDSDVQTATRTDIPYSQTAENMSVITAEDIADMNAHSLAEVLNRVPGIFVDFSGQDFNSEALLHTQGASERLTTVLVDGMVWNLLGGGTAAISSIPVQIIDRIEIIKGSASSAWGSALGGVINIITKGTGDTTIPKGMFSASYGEASSQDYNGELYGGKGPVGYYLFAGKQLSDGLRNNREMDRNRFYAKLNFTGHLGTKATVTAGYVEPNFDIGDVNANGIGLTSRVRGTTSFLTGSLDHSFSPEWGFQAGLSVNRQALDLPLTFTTPFLISQPGDLFKDNSSREFASAANIKLTYESGIHNAVFGADFNHGEIKQTTSVGAIYQTYYGLPASSVVYPSIDKWGLYTNDTINLGDLTLIPGVRVDHDNITGYFVSPNIGATYELTEHCLLRASLSRGFTSPPLTYLSGGGLFIVPNPELKREDGWAYQVMATAGIGDLLQLKTVLFRFDTHNAISDQADPNTHQINNIGNIHRQGYEVEISTAPYHGLSLKAAHDYVHLNMPDQSTSAEIGKDNYSYLLGIKYDDRVSWKAQLMGSYVWINQDSVYNAKYNTFIWDFTASKRFRYNHADLEIFSTIHNIFSGEHDSNDQYKNALRWAEAGIKMYF